MKSEKLRRKSGLPTGFNPLYNERVEAVPHLCKGKTMAKETAAQKREREAQEAEARRQAALTGEDGSDGAETSTDEDWNAEDDQPEGSTEDDEAAGRDAPEGETWDGTDEGEPEQPAHPDDESGTSLGGSSHTEAMTEDEAERVKEDANADAGPVQRVQIVEGPAETGGFVAGEALTPGQRAGLEPLDRVKDNEQAADRVHRTNMQTDHEADNGLDPTSSGPSPGITANASYTAAATGAPPSDMSGRPPLAENDRKALDVMRSALNGAKDKDAAEGIVKEERQGWRTPQEIGVAGGVMSRLQSIYPERIEFEEVPNGHHFPETGRRYRLK